MMIALCLLAAALLHEPAAALLERADLAAVVAIAPGKPPAVTVERALKGVKVGDKLQIAGWEEKAPIEAGQALVFLAKADGALRPIAGPDAVVASPPAALLDALAWPATFKLSFLYLDPRTEIDRALNLRVKVKNVSPEAALFDPARLRGRLFAGRHPALPDQPLAGDAVQLAAGETKTVTIDLHEVFAKHLEDQNDYRLELRAPGGDDLQAATAVNFVREAVGASSGN